jgi:pre-mRNA-splicing factor SYF2
MNHQEVVEEDKRNKLPSNWEARKRQADWVLENEQKRREAEAKVITFVSLGNYCICLNRFRIY